MNHYLLPTIVTVALLGGCGGEGAPAAPRRHEVEISGFEYRAAELTVAAGDTIVWVNRDAVPHTVTSAEGGWDSGSIAAGGSWRLVVAGDEGGTYLCTFHPSMTGELIVE